MDAGIPMTMMNRSIFDKYEETIVVIFFSFDV